MCSTRSSRAGATCPGYSEEVEDQVRSGAEIVELVAQRYSVNPRLLLAVLEYQSAWLRASNPEASTRDYPMGFVRLQREGLFSQLSLAADLLNKGYYLWRAGWQGPYVTTDGAAIPPGAGINAGTAGVQYLFSQLYASDDWRHVVGPEGFFATWTSLYGNPFHRAIEPLLPSDLAQPVLQLPFEDHGMVLHQRTTRRLGQRGGLGGARLRAAGQRARVRVVRRMGDRCGRRTRAARAGRRVAPGSGSETASSRRDGCCSTCTSRSAIAWRRGAQCAPAIASAIPSCEGGVSNGTHLHLARKYNGEWIAADGSLPFDLDGWVSSGAGREYDGTLQRGGVVLEACDCRNDGNQVAR